MPSIAAPPRAETPPARAPDAPPAGLLGRVPYPLILVALAALTVLSTAAGVAIGSVDLALTDWQQKRDFMRKHPALSKLTAVRDDCFLALPYAAMTPGVRGADAVVQIADLLHPSTSASPAAR